MCQWTITPRAKMMMFVVVMVVVHILSSSQLYGAEVCCVGLRWYREAGRCVGCGMCVVVMEDVCDVWEIRVRWCVGDVWDVCGSNGRYV